MYAAASLLRSGGNIYDAEELRAEAARRGIERLESLCLSSPSSSHSASLNSLVFPQAALAWYFLNILCTAFALLMMSELLGEGNRPWKIFIVTLLLATSEPLTRTLTAGQMNLTLLFLLSASIYCWDRNRPLIGGIALGAASALKVFPALLIVLMFWRRQWRFSWSALGSAVLFTLISAAIAGFRESFQFLGLLRQMGYGSSTWAHLGMHFHIDPANQAPAALITRFLTIDPEAKVYGLASMPGLARGLCYLMAITLLGLTFYATRYKDSSGIEHKQFNRLSYALGLVVCLLIPSLVWDHYLVLALLPMVIFLGSTTRKDISTGVVVLAALSLFLLNFHFNFWNPAYQGWKVVLTSIKLPGVLILLGLILYRLKSLSLNSDTSVSSVEK